MYGASDSPDEGAAAIAVRAAEAFTVDCVGATASGITLSRAGEQLRFEVRSSQLTIDDDFFILDFDGAASTTGTTRLVTFESRSRMTDQVDARASTGTITWEQGTPCVTIDAQSESSKDELTFSSSLVGFRQCAGACPSAGDVTVQGEKGVFAGTFDGSDELRVLAPNGGDRSYGLQCR